MGVPGIEALFLHFLPQAEDEGWGARDPPGAKIRISTACRERLPPETGTDCRPEALRSVVQPQPPGEQAISISIVKHIPGPPPGDHDGTGANFRPMSDVFWGIAHHRRLAPSPRGGVDSGQFLLLNGKQPKGIGDP